MKYPIVEIFTSIQGEGFWTGAPVNFVRLAGCNLSCKFCDIDKEPRENLTPEQIAARLPSRPGVVVITGGEPTIHDLQPLIAELHNWRVYLETNGTNPLPLGLHWVSVSPKRGHPTCIHADEAKWLIPEWSYPEIDWDLATFHYVQPVNYKHKLNHKNIRACLKLVYRDPRLYLSIQLHKVIGVR